MPRKLEKADMVDIRWAYSMVAKGVKAVAVVDSDLICEDDEVESWRKHVMEALRKNSAVTACYLDMLKDPARMGREYTGGDLIRPIMGVLRTGRNRHSVFFATNETMRDLFAWSFDMMKTAANDRDRNRAHAIMGLLCGYSPIAIEGFMKQPDTPAKVKAVLSQFAD